MSWKVSRLEGDHLILGALYRKRKKWEQHSYIFLTCSGIIIWIPMPRAPSLVISVFCWETKTKLIRHVCLFIVLYMETGLRFLLFPPTQFPQAVLIQPLRSLVFSLLKITTVNKVFDVKSAELLTHKLPIHPPFYPLIYSLFSTIHFGQLLRIKAFKILSETKFSSLVTFWYIFIT